MTTPDQHPPHRTLYRDSRPLLSRETLRRNFPAWALLLTVALMVAPRLLFAAVDGAVLLVTAAPGLVVEVAERGVEITGDGLGKMVTLVGDAVGSVGRRLAGRSSTLAPLFTAEVAYWAGDIRRWARDHDLDPNLLATIMQIESCGHPTIASPAGAQGLFQVMPFHFATGEDMLDPDTNARRGADFLNYCLEAADGDAGLAMACYNGGPSVLTKPFEQWLAEPQRYYTWGTGIYADAQQNSASSATLDRWLGAGGETLCTWAAEAIRQR